MKVMYVEKLIEFQKIKELKIVQLMLILDQILGSVKDVQLDII